MGRRGDVLLIAVGGGVGALVRHGVGEAVSATSFPWATFIVNIVGCALLAVATSPTRPKTQQRILGAGFCGGLTTFSTFSFEVASLTRDGRSTTAIIYIVASIAVGLAAFVAVRRQVQPGPPEPRSPQSGLRP